MSTRNLLSTIALLYAALEMSFVLINRTQARHRQRRYPWLYEAMAPFAFWLFLPSLLLLALIPVMEQSLFAVATLAASALFLGHFAWGAWSHPTHAQRKLVESKNPSLRIMTSNLYKQNRAFQEMAETVLAAETDIIVVQELRQEQATALSSLLADAFPFHDLHPGKDAEGMGIWSRYPLSHQQLLTHDGANPIQVVQVELSQGTVAIINMHPRIPLLAQSRHLALPVGLSTAERAQDVERIVAAAKAQSRPTIILGDMNTTPYCPAFGAIPASWVNVHQAIGKGLGFSYPVDTSFFGFRSPVPLFRIDHVFLKGDLAAHAIHNRRMPGSDHRFLIADLSLTNGHAGPLSDR